MAGIIVQLAISWLIIWFYEKGNLSVLGFWPTKKRLLHFIIFFFLTGACCASGFLLRMYFGKESWQVNPALNAPLILEGIWWNIKSVMFEELIFRGVLFYILIRKIGAIKAMILSSIAFGMYHWFSQEVFGNITQMAIIFLLTGIMGMLYAYGYVKSNSLYIPCAIHLGWNITQGFIFSQGSIGNGILVQPAPQPVVNVSYFVYFCILLVPLLSAWGLNFLLLHRGVHTVPPAYDWQNEKPTD